MGGGDLKKGWCLKPGIELRDLTSPQSVEELYGLALARGVVPEGKRGRLEFYALCHSCWRKRLREETGKGLRKPIGFLHTKLGASWPTWIDQADDQHDRAWAKRAIASVDASRRGTVPATVAAVAKALTPPPDETRDPATEGRRLVEEFGRRWNRHRERKGGS